MNYNICIPSFGRSEILCNKTLSTLHKFNINLNSIFIFVVEDEYDLYKTSIGNDYNIIVGVKGLVNQRNFIENYFDDGKYLIMIDDDITDIDLSLTKFTTLQDFFIYSFQKCIENNSFIWSVYPVFNPFFRQKQQHFTTNLNYCVGAFYGIINRPNLDNLQLNKFFKGDEKEDVLRTILYFIKDGIVLRFNNIGFKTQYYGSVGGMGKKNERIQSSISACKTLQNYFNDYGKIQIRKSGINEFKLKKIKSFNPDRSVTLLSKIDDHLIDELYNELQKITIKPLGKSNVRLNFNNTDRSVVFGLSRGRFSGKVDLSEYTKKHPYIWQLLQQIGEQLPDDFEYTSVFVNKNVICPPHKDKNNVGKSVLFSFGEYEGCNIVIDEIQYNAYKQPVLFNGALLNHYNTNDLVGNKYSLVFYDGGM